LKPDAFELAIGCDETKSQNTKEANLNRIGFFVLHDPLNFRLFEEGFEQNKDISF
jgi:hypothetical protein